MSKPNAASIESGEWNSSPPVTITFSAHRHGAERSTGVSTETGAKDLKNVVKRVTLKRKLL